MSPKSWRARRFTDWREALDAVLMRGNRCGPHMHLHFDKVSDSTRIREQMMRLREFRAVDKPANRSRLRRRLATHKGENV